MVSTKRPPSTSEIAHVFDLLKLTGHERRGAFKAFGWQPRQTGRRKLTYGTWVSNGSEPIKVDGKRDAKLRDHPR